MNQCKTKVKASGLALFLFFCVGSLEAQLTGISVEEYQVHSTTGIAELDGMVTYRVYIDCTTSLDEVSAVYGDATSPLTLTSTAGFYQDAFGEPFGWSINPALFGAFPSLEYDSWVTIGAENNVIIGTHNTVSMDMSSFESGGNLIIDQANGGSWFTLFGDAAAQAGDDLKVLIAQLTIPAGSAFTGNFNVQLFVNGEQSNSAQYPAVTFSSQADAIFGCMDPEATNYNADATEQGEVCIYPCTLDIDIYSPACHGEDGGVYVSASGGNGGFTYMLEGQAYTGAFETFLGAGIFEVSATDIDGCVVTEMFEITEPDPIEWELQVIEEPTCSNGFMGTMAMEATGGTEGLYELFVAGVDFPGASSFEWTSPAGMFTFELIDANGCNASGQYTLDGQPSMEGFQPVVFEPTCFGDADGSLMPDPNFDYTTWSVEWTGPSSGTSEVFEIIEGLSAGSYTLDLASAEYPDCASTISVVVGQPEALLIEVEGAGPNCPGELSGLLMAEVSEAQGSISWNLNGVFLSDDPVLSLFGLSAGTFALGVADEVGCASMATVVLDAPTDLGSFEVVIAQPTSFSNGSITLEVPSGTNVEWYDESDVQIAEGNAIEALSSGTYTATITSAQGCVEFISYDLDFAGCMLTDADDWPAEADGIFPTDHAVWYLGQELVPGPNTSTSEWILRIPELITDGGVNYPVVSFSLDSISNLPPGTASVDANWIDPVMAQEARCIPIEGIPMMAGDYQVTFTGTMAIALFGSSFHVDGFSFSKTVSVEASPDPVLGCTYSWATNFNPFATEDDGSCDSVWGCTYMDAENYDTTATSDDGTCIFDGSTGTEGSCFYDFDESGNVGATDLLLFLEAYGISCP
jgi:hypothetical protein